MAILRNPWASEALWEARHDLRFQAARRALRQPQPAPPLPPPSHTPSSHLGTRRQARSLTPTAPLALQAEMPAPHNHTEWRHGSPAACPRLAHVSGVNGGQLYLSSAALAHDMDSRRPPKLTNGDFLDQALYPLRPGPTLPR